MNDEMDGDDVPEECKVLAGRHRQAGQALVRALVARNGQRIRAARAELTRIEAEFADRAVFATLTSTIELANALEELDRDRVIGSPIIGGEGELVLEIYPRRMENDDPFPLFDEAAFVRVGVGHPELIRVSARRRLLGQCLAAERRGAVHEVDINDPTVTRLREPIDEEYVFADARFRKGVQ